jgi:hypothetical protein
MKKLRLDLAEVTVETFSTSSLPDNHRRTVQGANDPAAISEFGGGGCTMVGCSGGGKCSWDFACSRDVCSDICTNYPGCSDDGNCSLLAGCTGLTVCFWTP